mgnify:CR=1 FL=1
MNAYITGGFNCGFGSIYDSIYRFYNTQEYLKKLGYSVKIYVDFGAIPQKHPQALFYEWYIESIPDAPNKAVELYLDNLKWVK